MPGSVPATRTLGTIEYHCLDTRQPVAEQLAAEERASPHCAGAARWLSSCSPPRPSCVVMVALGLVRVLRGPGHADRMMAAQLLGTGAIGALLLVGAATGDGAVLDVALTLALLAAFASIAFVKFALRQDEAADDDAEDPG